MPIYDGASFTFGPGGGGAAFSAGVSNLGNTLGQTGVTGTRLVMAGIGNLTLSQLTDINGGTISISGGTAAGGAFSLGVSGGNTAGDTGATGSRVVLAGGNGITLSQATDLNGGSITISGITQSAQTQDRFDLTIDGNTAGAPQLVSSGTLTLAGGTNITLSQNGNAISIIGAAGGVETQTFVAGVAASDTTYTSGTVRITGVGGGVTVSSNTGQRVDISVAAPVAQTVQTQNLHNVTLSGNTAGVLAQISSGTMTLAGGNNITVSQNGNAVTISGANAGGAQTGISGVAASNTTYTSGTVTFTGVGGGITVSSNTGQRVDLSVAAQSVQPGIQHLVVSNTTFSSGTVSLSGFGAITVNTAANIIRVSGPTQTAESQSIGMSNLGNTSGTTGIASGAQVRFLLAGGNNITLSQSLNGASGTITISAPNAQTGISGLANSQTTYTSGTVSLSELGAITIRSTTGNQYQFSVNSQTVQTQNMVAVTLSGNTSGVQALMSSGTMTLAGGNNITVSQNGNAVTISGPNVGGAQTGISGLANSETTYTSGTVSLSELGAITIRSTTGQQFQLSVNSQSNQSEGWYALGNTTGQSSSTTLDARTISLRGDGIISLGYSNGSVRISASQSVQPETQTFVAGIANSQTTYTSGTVSLSELGAITIRSTTGNQFQLSVNAQSAESQSIGMSNLGNTSGTTGIASGAQVRMLFAGGNNITLSQSLNGASGTITISGPNTAAQTNQTLGMYAVQNTTGQSSSTTMDARTLSVAGDGAVSVGYSAGSLRISAPTQTVQTQNVHNVTLSGNTAGAMAQISSGTMTLAGGNNITLSQAGNAVTISGGAGGGYSAGVSNIGNTSGDTGVTGTRMVLAGGNNITLSQSTNANGNTVTVSAFNQTVESQSIGASNLGNTLGTSGVASGGQVRAVIIGTSNITVSQSVNGASATLSLIGQPSFSGGVSNLGNSAGDTGATGTRLVFVGSNNITLSQTTGAAGGTVSIIGGAGGAFSAGASNLGNTQGDTGITGTRLVLVGTNNITLSQVTDANGATVRISGQSPAGGAFSGGVSNLGNTDGATGITGTQLVLVGTNAISLSQTTGANGGTVSIDAPATSSLVGAGNITISTNGSTISIADTLTPLNFWDNMVPGASTTFELSNAGLQIFPLNPANAGFPGFMSVSSVFFDMSGTVSTAAAFTRSLSLGVYTLVNSTQLSRLYSASTSWGTGAGNMNINDSMGGRRWVTLHSSQFDAAPNFHAGSDYFMAVWHRSSSGSQTFAFQGQLLPYATGLRSGFMSAASATNTTLGQYPFLGVYSASFSTGMPAALAASDINKSVATAISLPRLVFNNVGSNIV